MAVVYQGPHALLDVPTHYCPGCTHGVIHEACRSRRSTSLAARGAPSVSRLSAVRLWRTIILAVI